MDIKDKKRINVLIVEDDDTQGKALEEAFKRAGYTTEWTRSSEVALNFALRTEFQCLIVDCMLPKMNGIDLVKEIISQIPAKPKIFLITGIFKDKNFMREAMHRVGANQFFTKPLDLEQLLTEVEDTFGRGLESGSLPILDIYSSRILDDQDLVKMIEQDSTLHAFHLPKLYQRMQETHLSGELALTSSTGQSCSILFSGGRIFSVNVPDRQSFFGSLAVSHGFVAPDMVLEALKDPSDKPLGQKLINALHLSPHAIHVVLEEQLALRLSQTVQNDVITLRWTAKKHPEPVHCLAELRFEQLIEDWLSSKITADWIKTALMSWGPFQLEGLYHATIQGAHSIEEVFFHPDFLDERDVRLLFSALLRAQAFIGARGERGQDFSFLASRLEKMLEDMKSLNFFQFMGVGENVHPKELNRAFEGLKQSFDPTSLPAECPPEIAAKCGQVFQYVEKAFSTLTNAEKREKYQKSLQGRRAQEMMSYGPMFQAAVTEVKGGNYAAAEKKLQSLIDSKLDFKDLRAYRIWAGIKRDRNFNGLNFDQIPPEERHSAPFMMARGVYHQAKGRFGKALNAFRTALVLDPELKIAKHELDLMISELRKDKTQNLEILRDVTTVVETFFGKISRRSVS